VQLSGPAPLDDILDTLEPATLPAHEFPWMAAVIVAVVLLVTLALFLWRRRARGSVIESLEQRTRRRLQELAEITPADARAFHVELSALLIEYAEQRIGLRSTRLTSPEILREFRRNGRMSAAWQESLAAFLAACDHAKFAPSPVAEWDAAATIAHCRALFNELAAEVASAPRLASPWEGWSNAAV
jgi:hypothetical protein